MRKRTDKRWYDLLETISQSGCPLCRMERQFEERYLDTLFYENITDPAIRESLRLQGGFCPDHVQLIHRSRPSVLGIAILYADLTKAYLSDARPPKTACSLCEACQAKERSLQEALVRFWKDLKMHWGPRTFLCPRHFHDHDWPEPIRGDLEHLTARSLSAIAQLLESLTRRFDYQSQRGSTTPDESLSWQEILEFFSHSFLRKTK